MSDIHIVAESESESVDRFRRLTVFNGKSIYPHRELTIPQNDKGISLMNFPLNTAWPREWFTWQMPDSDMKTYKYFPPRNFALPIRTDMAIRGETRANREEEPPYSGRVNYGPSQRQMSAFTRFNNDEYYIFTYQVNKGRYGVKFSKVVIYMYKMVNIGKRRYGHIPDDVPRPFLNPTSDDPPDILTSIIVFDGEPYEYSTRTFMKIREILPITGGKTRRKVKRVKTRRR